MMNGGALAEERWTKIVFHWKAMKGSPRELIRPFHGPLAVVMAKAKHILVRETLHRIERTITAKRVEEFQKGILSLAANNIIHIARVKRCIRVERWEVSTPADRYSGPKTANLTGCLHRRCHLGSGHRGDAQQFNLVLVNEVKDAGARITFKIPVYDLILLPSLKHRGEGENRERQPPVPRLGSTGMIEDDHALTDAV
jgi:hypothetical protein